MARVLRRCLDCDCTFAITSDCPRCASKNTLVIRDEAPSGLDEPKIAAILLIVHAVQMSLATSQAPGLLLGSCLFANGLCSVLLLVGVESMPRVVRICAALSAVLYVAIIAITGQALLFLPAAVVVVAAALLLYQDSTAPWLKPTLGVGVAGSLLLAVLIIVSWCGVRLPGWWHGEYLFKDRELSTPSALPEAQRR